jgi:hypothetical protein
MYMRGRNAFALLRATRANNFFANSGGRFVLGQIGSVCTGDGSQER